VTLSANPLVAAVSTPPVAEVQAWIRDRAFPPDKPLLDLAQAVPSYAPAESLTRHVGAVAREPETSLYSAILGTHELRAAFAAHLRADYSASVEAENVAITSGCNQAFCVAVSALAGPGDEVVLSVPYYFNHLMWLQMQGIEPVCLPFDAAEPGRMPLGRVEEAVTPRTRAVVLVSPCNPTGAEFPSADIEAIHGFLSSRGISLIIDETYKDFRADPGPPHALMSAGAHAREGLVQLFSFSKAYSLTGYRVGAIACGRALMAEIEKVLDCVAICPPRISQEAAHYAIEHLDEWRDAKAALMRERVSALRDAFARSNLTFQLISSGAYFAYVRHPFRGRPAREVARYLADHENMLCLPGSFFGPGQEDYLRLAFANVEGDRFPELLERLHRSTSNLSPGAP
jgi:aspartate/methionine/tyrosine aminotransferase